VVVSHLKKQLAKAEVELEEKEDKDEIATKRSCPRQQSSQSKPRLSPSRTPAASFAATSPCPSARASPTCPARRSYKQTISTSSCHSLGPASTSHSLTCVSWPLRPPWHSVTTTLTSPQPIRSSFLGDDQTRSIKSLSLNTFFFY
jgi:hypothetical protein